MSPITYEEVRPWARAIGNGPLCATMPPWYIEKNIGIQHYKNDLSLSELEIAKIAKWPPVARRKATQPICRHPSRSSTKPNGTWVSRT